MKIAVLGLGNVGGQLTRLWLAAGHQVTAGLREGSKDRETATGMGARVAVPAEAVKGTDVIAIALPWLATESTLATLGPLKGRVILDATNPMDASLRVIVPPAGSAALQIAQSAAGARVVKAFNTVGAAFFGEPTFDMMYCGDDADTKNIVRKLIEDTHMKPVDVGPLSNAGYLEQIAGLWVDLAVKGRIQGGFAFNLVRKQG
jgi:8-hydroxy-5-deazaflavin:NADPH oxidoreductase